MTARWISSIWARTQTALISFAVIWISPGCSTEKHDPPMTGKAPQNEIQWDQLGKEIKVIGPLGPPVGEIVTIRGHFRRYPPGYEDRPSKDDSYTTWVRVDEVNGRVLSEPYPIEVKPLFGHDQLASEKDTGLAVTAVGYQEGRFIGFPGHPRTRVIQSRSRQFDVFFVVLEYSVTKQPASVPTDMKKS